MKLSVCFLSLTIGMLVLSLVMSPVDSKTIQSSQVVRASVLDGGDFSLDFTAAAPQTYNHLTGGGAYDDRTVGVADDIVESLEGGDFTCNDIVTFLTEITVDAGATGEQSIELDFVFLADTTGQSGAAFTEIVGTSINYGDVGGDGPGGTDLGMVDDGGSTATLVSSGLTGPAFMSGSELLATVAVDDLEAGETVILRIDVRLDCLPGASPTGNLQGKLDAARVVAPTPDAIPGGAQTIPFLHLGQLNVPLMSLSKTVQAGSLTTCPGLELAETVPGGTVTYCYEINSGGDEVLDLTLWDDNGTPGDTSDDFDVLAGGTIVMGALTDEDGDGFLDDLAANSTLMVAYTLNMPLTAMAGDSIINVGTADGSNNAVPAQDTAEVLIIPCTGPMATTTNIGPGCGAPTAPLLTVTPPIIGQDVIFTLSTDHPNAHYWIFASVGVPATYTDPISGCTVYVDIFNPTNFAVLAEGFTNAMGEAVFTLPLPPDTPPGVYGVQVTFQARTWFPGGPLAGDHLSNGVTVEIGCF